MNGHVSISTSAYSIYNAANRNDADNSSWFRVIRRCIYRSSIIGGMFALCINSGSITFDVFEIVSSWRYPCVLVCKAFYRFYLFKNCSREFQKFSKMFSLSRYANTQRTEVASHMAGEARAAINTAINRHHKSLALLPSVSISLSVPYPSWISTDEDDNEKKELEKNSSEHPRVGRGTNARTRFHKRTRRRGCSR